MAVSADPVLAGLRKQLGSKRYRALVKEAHTRGFKVRSYAEGKASGVPEGMIERTTRSLRAEAESAVGAAFKPAETYLTTALERETALNAKRDRDMQQFQQWSAAQTERFTQASLAAQTALLTSNQEILAEAGQARSAIEQASRAQLQGVGMGEVAQFTLQNQPVAQAAAAGAKGIAAAGAQRVAGQIGANTERAGFEAANVQATLAGQQQQAREAGEQRRTAILDRIAELHGKKGEAFVNTLSDLTKAEQTKAITKYESDVASAIASGKQAFEADQAALDRATKASESKKERANKRALERMRITSRRALHDLDRGLDDDKFLAQYGKTRAEYREMTGDQRAAWNRKYQATKGKGATDPLVLAPTEARNYVGGVKSGVSLILDEARAMRAKGKTKITAAEIRQVLTDEGVDANLHDYIVNVFKSKTPGRMSPAIRKKLERIVAGHAEIPSRWY